MPDFDGHELGVVARLPPKEAISYFQSKGWSFSWHWFEMVGDAHAREFTVAKCVKLDVLNSIRAAVESALADGLTEEQFMAQLTPTLQRLGWWGKQVIEENGELKEITLGSPRRLRTIYQVNTRTAYAAGRYAQMMNNADIAPYWQYVAIIDSHTRPEHAALHLMVFRYDSPFWKTHYPPNDWECRCSVRALSEGRWQASGIPVTDASGMLTAKEVVAGTDFVTGDEYKTTVTTFNNGKVSMTPGKGWSYNVGSAAFGTDAAACRKLIETPDPALRRQFIQSLNNSPARQVAFGSFVNRVVTGRAIAGAVQVVGFVSDDIATQLRGVINAPPPRMLTMDADTVTAATTDAPAATVATLPGVVARPAAVLVDTRSGEVLYVGNADDAGRRIAAVIPADAMNSATLDAEIHARMTATDDIQAGITAGHFRVLQGVL
ncbi:phage head morphogenesis protein [Citrobacter braakii]|uniref:phage head morphogenesis protein n=1 Tax=Citrobacter braakii TaxID=57706 RepID=UPI004039C703